MKIVTLKGFASVLFRVTEGPGANVALSVLQEKRITVWRCPGVRA